LHNVRILTDRAGKQFCLLENWQANFGEAESTEDFVRGLLDAIP
jgi:hypothetical protein